MLLHFQQGQNSQVTDSSGRGYHGNFVNAGWGNGYLGAAGFFNGSRAYVEIPHSEEFRPGAITLAAWLYLTGSPGNFPHDF